MNGTGIAIPHTSYEQSYEQNALSKVRPTKLALKEKFMERIATAGAGLWCKKGSSNCCLLHQRHRVAEVAALPLRPRPAAAVQTPRATEIQNQGCSWTPSPTGFQVGQLLGCAR
jgi:hypothetical protein